MTKKQILVLLLTAAAFVMIDLSIYSLFTSRLIDTRSEGMQAKSIELSEYLPEKGSGIVQMEAEKLEGELPVIDGAAALYPVFSALFYARYPGDAWEFDGADFTEKSRLRMENTRGAWQRLADGEDDLIFCAAPSEEQLAYAAEKGVEFEMVPVGREAFVFLVNEKNPVTDLSQEEIRGIYGGGYKSWKELGGEDKRLLALTRNEGSGSQTAFLSFMNGREIRKDILGFIGSPIGFSFRYYVEGIVGKGGIRMLSVDGVYPDREHIRSGEYPLTSYFYAAYRKGETNPNVQALVDFALSEEGQQIIEESGYAGVK